MNFSQIPGRIAHELADFPHIQKMDLGNAQLAHVASAINKFMDTSNVASLDSTLMHKSWDMKGHPEEDALLFYMLNHAFSLVRQKRHPLETLSPAELALVQQYKAHMSIMVPRMFYYLLLICTRESRHDAQDKLGSKYKGLIEKYGLSVTQFHKSLAGKGSEGAASALKDKPPTTDLGSYTKFLSEVFYVGSYSSGFGGKAWGKIADVARDFSNGVLSAEMMLDTSYTLAHNNGPIFNKGMLFHSYSHQIYKILDVQRAGMIPQLVGTGKLTSDAKTSRVLKAFDMCAEAFPAEFSGEVDWVQVEKLGSMKKYPQEIAEQKAKGSTPKVKTTHPSMKTIIEEIDEDIEQLQPVSQGKKVYVYPGQFILKVKR